jgi:hypothetical protein
MARSTAALAPAITTWPGELKFTALTTSPCAASAQPPHVSIVQAENGGHATLPGRNGFLHQLATALDQLHRIARLRLPAATSALYSPRL